MAPSPRIFSTAKPMMKSALKKKAMAKNEKMSTMTVEISVSRRDGQVTFAVSALTCWRKTKGLYVFDAMPALSRPVEPGLLDEPADKAIGRDMPPDFQCRRIGAVLPSMQIRRVKPVSQLHASRVCHASIKPILSPRKWQQSVL